MEMDRRIRYAEFALGGLEAEVKGKGKGKDKGKEKGKHKEKGKGKGKKGEGKDKDKSRAGGGPGAGKGLQHVRCSFFACCVRDVYEALQTQPVFQWPCSDPSPTLWQHGICSTASLLASFQPRTAAYFQPENCKKPRHPFSRKSYHKQILAAFSQPEKPEVSKKFLFRYKNAQ